MATIYSIRDLESLSGIKAHTIRIWEQRYGILKAQRTTTNIRFYSEDELKYLMSLALLNRHGYKISKLAGFTHAEVSKHVLDMIESPTEFDQQISGLTLATIEFNEEKFEKILSTSFIQLGFEEAMKKVVFPFLEKVGMLWVSGSIIAAQEHFISQIIRQKIIVAIDGQVTKWEPGAKKFVLFLPNSEWHELSLLFLYYLLKSRSQRVLYLGASVPLKDVIEVGKVVNPDYFYTIITAVPQGYSVKQYLNQLAEEFPAATVFTSGLQMTDPPKDLVKNITVLNGLPSVLSRMEEISA
jgi:DNA-binding transcriptional MerR regulator